MNYIIEDGIDFWSALNNDEDTIECKIEKCLLTNTKLTRNYITLPCDHKFNYVPLFNETVQSKQYQKYNKFPLRSYEVRCPYCRTRHSKLLPWIPIEGVEYNSLACSKTRCLSHKKCTYCYKSGKSKGNKCNDLRGFEGTDGKILCIKHRKQLNKKKVNTKVDTKLSKDEERFLKKVLKKQMQSYLEANNKQYKKSATKLVLMRTMQQYNLKLDLDIVSKIGCVNTIIS